MRWISPWKNRWLRRLTWAVVTGCTLVLLAWLAGPSLIKSQIEARGQEALGRKVTVEAVAFKPWSLELTLSRLQVAAADGQSAQFAVENVYARAQWQSLWRLAPVVDALRIDAPHVQIKRAADGRFDWDDILQRLAARPHSTDDRPPRFALYNLEVTNGSVDFEDQPGAQTHTHQVRKLQLAVPFVSGLESDYQVVVQPRLAFVLNGMAFDSAAQTLPFAKTRKSDVTLTVSHLDLKPWLPYMPADMPVSVQKGVVDATLRLAFEQSDQPRLSLSGTVTLSGLELAQRDGTPLLSAGQVHTVLKDVRPLERWVQLESIAVSAPRLQARRNAQGRVMVDFAARSAPAGTGTEATSPAKADPAAPAKPWRLELERFALRDGAVYWTDLSAPTPVRWVMNQWDMTVKGVQWPRPGTPSTTAPATPQAGGKPRQPMHLEASATLAEVGGNRKAANVVLKGQGDDHAGRAELTLTSLGLDMLSPYLQPYLMPRASGTLGGQVQASWESGKVKLAVPRVSLEKFALTLAQAPTKVANASDPADAVAADNQAPNPKDLPSWDLLEIGDSAIDLGARTASIGKITLRKPNARVVREPGGTWMFERWLKPRPSVAQVNGSPAPPWKLTLADVSLEDGTVVWLDRVPAKRVFVELSALKLQAKSVVLDGKTPTPVQLSAQVRSGRNEPGSLRFTGSVMAVPFLVQGALEAKQLPLVAAQPYFVNRFNIELPRASGNFKGQVRFAATDAGPALQVKGDASVDDLRANSVLALQKGSSEATVEELLNWKSMAMPGLDLTIAPHEPLRLKIREVALSDFYARLIIDAEGQLVLQDLVKPEDTGPPVSAAPANAVPADAAQAASPAQAKSLTPVIDVGPVTVINGRVAFSDRFIKPNYSADLTALNGTLSRFRSRSPDGVVEMADLELKGRAEGSAGLEIVGKVNPLADPLALDIRGKVRDLELSPLSSYAMKYAGYGIERGKLSMDVNYSIKPNGDLAATNKITLSQLTFGDKVEGAATNLPVKLVVALLSDSKGVIDLNLPVSGSLKDPEFKMWPIIWKIVGNIFTKAITSPFSLFSGSGEEEDLAQVAFTPGTAVLTPEAVAGLDKALKVLRDKPSLKTTIVGTASLEAERDAIKQDQLNRMLLAEKRRVVGNAGGEVAAVSRIDDAEYPALLKEVYRRSDFKKPRNLMGMTKDVPPEQMRAFLLDNIRVDEDSVRTLARNRGITVREYLTARELPSERIFLGNEELAPSAANWKPQAELSVTAD